MSTPYWGQLPPPKARRVSDDHDRIHRRQSSEPSVRLNRISAQTANTESTAFSPLASPITPSSHGAGLAPRPPSLPYNQSRYPDNLIAKRRRRSSRNQTDDDDGGGGGDDASETPVSPPPAAPDVPRAPPVSYRHHHGNGDVSYTYAEADQPARPRPSPRSDAIGSRAAVSSVSHYGGAMSPTERQTGAPESGRHRSQGSGRHDGSLSSPRTQESSYAEPQRKMWADHRSPLQRLELTLDSITKEEKRARVEAAERRAKERVAQRDAAGSPDTRGWPLQGGSAGQQVRFRDRRPPAADAEERRRVVTDPLPAQPSAATRDGPLSQNPPEDAQPHAPLAQSPRSRIPVARNFQHSPVESTGMPQRNRSFRERAAGKDAPLPRGADEIPSPRSSDGGLMLSRSGSNKLKKNPPGDPWYTIRREAEERAALYNKGNAGSGHAAEAPLDELEASHQLGPSNGRTTKRNAPLPEDLERPPARGKRLQGFDSYEETPSPGGNFATAMHHGRSKSMGAGRHPDSFPTSYGASTQSDETLESEGSAEPPTRRKDITAHLGLDRATTHRVTASTGETRRPFADETAAKTVKFSEPQHQAHTLDDQNAIAADYAHGWRDYMHRDHLKPGQGMYKPPTYLDEWKKATVGTLHGSLLDISEAPPSAVEAVGKDTAWWENGGKRSGSLSTRPPMAEAFDGEYADTRTPTRFKPPLYLTCGPLLRYCGTRHEKPVARTSRTDSVGRDIWRGSVMIVTQDSQSSYEISPTLRLFVQPIELLPPPPAELRGSESLPPEYVDPIAGIPKLGRRGETLYVRPVEHLEESLDASMLEPDDGLFEISRTAPNFDNSTPDPPGSFTSRKKRIAVDGEKVGKYKDVRGFRLHSERGHTFWRFNIEVELRQKQQRLAYRINRGPATGFWVPARSQSMNIMFHSCNGFSLGANPDDFSGPDPMWRDVLNNHQTRPFHVMIGGGDQVYNDAVMRDTRHFQDWLGIRSPLHKNNAPFTSEMQDELELFYLERYMKWFSQGLFGLANSQIPMVNMYDDHDIIDGFGSYPDHFMKSPVFSGLGNVAFKYYMLFQHQSLPGETEQTEPSWCLGLKPGPYIQEVSRSLFMSLGAKVALLAVDCRTERTRDEVLREDTWEKLLDRCYDEIAKGKTEHLLVLLGVPIAYPRLVWLENILTSRLMDPIKALSKAGMLGNLLNRFDGGVEVLDDLDDHWTAKNHKDERKVVIEDLQDLAAERSVRVTILSGDVHLAAVGQFYSNPQLHLAKHKDFRYIPNIISSAIANAPPPDLLADVLNKRNKVHHFDKDTDEDMIPIFSHGVDGKARNNKHLLPHRNWCSIREYVPGHTPPSTPPPEDYEYTPEGTPPGSRSGLFRRFSLSKSRGPASRPDTSRDLTDRSRPPISSGFRSLSRRASNPSGGDRPNKLVRTFSLGSSRPRNIFRRNSSSTNRPDDGGINGSWGADSDEEAEEDIYNATPPPRRSNRGPAHPAFTGGDTLGLRGGAGDRAAEYEVGDDSYFTARPPRRGGPPPPPHHTRFPDEYTPSPELESEAGQPTPPRPGLSHRTPTSLSAKKKLRRNGAAAHTERYAVDVKGSLDVCLNVEVNPRDPAGITVPYRLLVPRLWGGGGEYGGPYDDDYDDDDDYEEEVAGAEAEPPRRNGFGGSLKRLFSGRGSQYRARRGGAEGRRDEGW
ncbi:hypothetical protein GGR56DRAFT_666767 [Xylariaceae sp. FL0804]|nr:hypothetical protein GGR56DRAFT_666767 [Xylariaceae sp. FL0804]